MQQWAQKQVKSSRRRDPHMQWNSSNQGVKGKMNENYY